MTKPSVEPSLEHFGKHVDSVSVTIGTEFLELFSRNLYSSPNKAFEELVSNSWDAEGSIAYIGVPTNLLETNATLWVLDNGESMDSAGLHSLWQVGKSNKSTRQSKRKQIGMFGVGKLATYLLAHRLTYVCKAKDGIIRAVEMDYRQINDTSNSGSILEANSFKLPMKELSTSDLDKLIASITDGSNLKKLIQNNVPIIGSTDDFVNEFGQSEDHIDKVGPATWTLALMSSLKDDGRKLQIGRLRWMLRSALPLGNSMSMVLNGEQLTSSKIDKGVVKRLELGPGFPTKELRFKFEGEDITAKVTTESEPFPHVLVDYIEGPITGTATLYDGSITQGKSDKIGRSNGFFINVLGRVINASDQGSYFGLENLSHTVWSEFRACVRSDGLNTTLKVSREALDSSLTLAAFRALLRDLFNQCRRRVDEPDPNTAIGEELATSWGAIPLRSFQRSLRSFQRNNHAFPESILHSGPSEIDAALDELDEKIKSDPGAGIREVAYEKLGRERQLYCYDLITQRIIVNVDHPFAIEIGIRRDSKRFFQGSAISQLLSDLYLVDVGATEEQITDFQAYRDSLYRIISRITRQSGATIARILFESTSDADNLEVIVGDALDYLGFNVEPKGETGEPDGIATSPLPRSHVNRERPYSFTYDAKSTRSTSVQTKDVAVAGLKDHRLAKEADYILVVGPDFQAGKLDRMALRDKVTPMRAKALARLLILAASSGPIDLGHFESVFGNHEPDMVDSWVNDLEAITREKPRLRLNTILDLLTADIKVVDEDAFNASVIAHELKKSATVKPSFTNFDVRKVFEGLSVLAPALIRVDGDLIRLGTSPEKLREAIADLVDQLPPELQHTIEDVLSH